MPKNWSVYEPESVYQYLEKNNDKIQVGDFVNYETNNQMGMVRYVVVLGEDGKKSLKQIADYYSMMDDSTSNLVNDEEETDDDEMTTTSPKKGGKRRRRRKTMKKTKRRKKSRRHKKTRRSKKY
jgi:hypothetical protein